MLDRFAELNRRTARARALEKQVSKAAGDPESYVALGRSYAELGRWEQAAGMYRAVLERDPGHVRALSGLSHAYLNRGDVEEAAGLAHQVIARAPNQREACEAHFTVGYVEAKSGRLDQARQAFERALQVDTTYAKAHHALGNLHVIQGRLVEAEQAYKAAIRHRPDWVDPRLSLGQCYVRQQAYDEAIEEFEGVLRLDAANARAYYALGEAREKTGDLDAALRAYRSFIAHWKGDAQYLEKVEAGIARLASR